MPNIFDNVVFPDYPMIHGLNKHIKDEVSINGNGTYEYRVKRSRWERYMWSIPTQSMTDAQKEEIKNFLVQRNHALNSFKFVDPDATQFSNALLSHNSGDYWNLALPYGTSIAGTHPIFNPVVGSLSVTVGGVGDTINAFTILNGVPVIQITGTTSGSVVRVTGPIYFTVRLATELSYALAALDACAGTNTPIGHTVNSIELVEVYGEY